MTETEWYYSQSDDHREGPISSKELSQLAESGHLTANDLIWKSGMDEWVPASRIKGLDFARASESVAIPPALPGKKRFDTEAVRATLRETQLRMDEAAGVLWFLDLKFTHFVSGSVIRFVWAAWLVFAALGLVSSLIVGVLKLPILEAAAVFGGYVLLMTFLTLLFRMFLEYFLVLFRMAGHVAEINERSARGERQAVDGTSS